MQDADGKPVPGFALDDCEPIRGDHITRVVKWRAGDDVGAQSGKTIRVRFEMSDGDLHAFRFTEK